MRETRFLGTRITLATCALALITAPTFCSILFLGFGHLSYAQGINGDNEPHATGLILMSLEQKEAFRRTHGRVEKVLPNRLALERINRGRVEKGLLPLPEYGFAPLGKEIISSKGESAPGAQAATSEVPSYVDNSQLSAFPVIRSQGSLGSCTCFATVYYQLTHMTGLVYGWDNKNEDNTTKFSPKWNYNMLNQGENQGTSFEDNYAVLEKHGGATWAEFPYYGENDPINYRPWCMNTQTWRNAINYRANPVTYVDVDSDEPNPGLEEMKQILANGYVVTFGTCISSWQFTKISNDKSTKEDDAFVRKPIAYWVNGELGKHAMTIVGYNDIIWVDINKNRKVEPEEKGAFRIANSWGTAWKEGGFTWLAYDALRSTSSVGPNNERVRAIFTDMVFVITAKEHYEPEMVAEFTVNHALRDQLRVDLDVSDTGSTIPSAIWDPGAINFQGGPYAFDGSTNPCDGTFVFDFTDLLPVIPETKRYYLRVHDNVGDEVVASLHSFGVRDVNGGETWAIYPPETIDGGQFDVFLDHTPAPPDITAPAAVGNLATSSPTSNSIVLTWAAPGDNGTEGTASQYDIRYATSAITEANWEAATQCPNEPPPSPAGIPESFTVTGLSPNTEYWVALKTADGVPNWSGLSNSPSGMTEGGGVQTMHVSVIDVSLKEKGPNVNAIATVTIVDALGAPVSEAMVSGLWSGATSDTDSGITDASGKVSLNSDKVRNPAPGTTFTFTVDNVVKTGWAYDENANVETSASISTPLAAPAAVYTNSLGNVFPSPANPETWIPFTLSKAEHVVIKIYNVAGQLVRTLELGDKAAGAYLSKDKAAYWDGRNATGEKVSSGIYFYLMEAGSFRAAKRMLIIQ